jgi:hypothetical protein
MMAGITQAGVAAAGWVAPMVPTPKAAAATSAIAVFLKFMLRVSSVSP